MVRDDLKCFKSPKWLGSGPIVAQIRSVKGLAPKLRFISDTVQIPSDGPFVLCDYGAADGGASHDLIAKIIGKNHCSIY